MSDVVTLEREVMKNGFQIQSLEDAMLRGDANVEDIRREVTKLKESQSTMEKSLIKWESAASATERYSRDIANKAITLKQFYVGLAGVIIAFSALLVTLFVGVHS